MAVGANSDQHKHAGARPDVSKTTQREATVQIPA